MTKQFWVSFCVVLCLTGCKHQQDNEYINDVWAKEIMQDVSYRNLHKELLTAKDDTLMRRVVSFYSEHGNSNELMEAYYLLGSVYRDLHDAPKALEAYKKGISVADTTSDDCRYDVLVRLYGQKIDILYQQKLFKQAADEVPTLSHYAKMAHDTLYIVDAQWVRLEMLYKSGDYVSVADGCWELLEQSKKLGLYAYAASQLNTCIHANINLQRIDDAQRLMTIYEQKSGDVDMNDMTSSFPIYYYTKGRLLTARHKLDSAEIFFRRELSATDWNNQQAAYRGLREVFTQKGLQDSINKYAVLQCEAVDSDYQTKLSENLQDLQELYDYSRAQEESFQKDIQLHKEQRKALYMRWGFAFALFALAFLFYHLRTCYLRKVTEAELELERANTCLMEKEAEVMRLQEEMTRMEDGQQKAEMALKVEAAEKEAESQLQMVQKNQKVLDELRRKARLSTKSLRLQYYDTPVFMHLMDNMAKGRIAQTEDYEEIKRLLQQNNPHLMQHIQALPHVLSETEMKTVLLLRIGLTQTEVGALTAHGKTAVANTLNRLYEKVNLRKPLNSGESYEWLITI